MEKKANGLVLRAVDYGEKDKILTILTSEEGLMTAGIKGVKKAGAKLKFASEPFCFAEYVFASTGNRNTVVSASIYDGFYPLREDIRSYYAASVIAEFMLKFCPEGAVTEEGFTLAIKGINSIANEKKNPYGVLVSFFTKALRVAGYGLDTDGIAKTLSKFFTMKL
ncbi:MAG: DNA repair protein RecO [Clostridia bacterium]|nr:DNA repair protein RecO [Clostridia bacterium]